jgi:transcriptional regulator with XRE-family HTH domain
MNAPSMLLAWLKKTKATQDELSKRLRVSRSLISHWLTGKRRPSPPLRDNIERIMGIPREAWYTSDEANRAKGRR